MRVLVLNKPEFDSLMAHHGFTDDNIEKQTNFFFISVNDTMGTWSNPYFKEDHDNVLTLSFDDIGEEGEFSPTNEIHCVVFDEEMAENLYNFIVKNKDRKTCIVHCIAGVSRSGGVGLFINDFFGGDKELFKRENSHIHPNWRVFSMLKNQINK